MITTAPDTLWRAPKGTPVNDAAGRRLGSVWGADRSILLVRCGRVFAQVYPVKMGDVDRFEDGELFLSRTKAEVVTR